MPLADVKINVSTEKLPFKGELNEVKFGIVRDGI